MKLFTSSFFLETGKINSGFLSYNSTNLSWYLDNLKKYASSVTFLTSRPQSGHLPSTSWVAVQNDSQGTQYSPS